jgi:O-antigen/teichoic acid export membrane protein
MYGVRVLTSTMLPEEYGKLSLSLTYVALMTQVLFAPLCAGSTRFYIIAKENDDLFKYVNAIKYFLLLFLSFSTIITIIIFIVLLFLNQFHLFNILFFSLILATTSGINMIFTSIQLAARKRSMVAIIQGLDSWSKYLLAILFVVFWGAFTTSVIFGYILSSLLILAIQIYFLKELFFQKNYQRDKLWEKKILIYIWPYMTWGLFTWSQISSDKWALAFYSTPKMVGLYNALYQIGYFPITIIIGFAIQLLTPIFFQRAGDGTEVKKIESVSNLTSKIVSITFLLTTIIFIISLFSHKLLFNLFFHNKEYLSVSYLLPWLILSGGIFACGQALTLEMMSKMKMLTLAIIKITTAIVGISMNILFAYLFDIRGIVFSSLLFSILYFTWIYLKTKKSLQ